MIDLKQLVDPDRGLISPQIFSDPEIHRQEMEAVFDRSWLFLAHESQFNRAGDFFTTYMGSNPVLVVMQKDGSLRCFLNVCRHRGMRVCKADEGKARSFMCAYHGWTYNQGGELVSVPALEAYSEPLDNDDWSLAEVAQLDSYKGLVFATWNPTAPPLAEALGDMAWYLDAFFDRLPGGSEVIDGVVKWRLKGNWKQAAEQFTSDMYHLPITHASAMMAMLPPDAPPVEIPDDGRQFSSPQGHGTGFFFGADAAGMAPEIGEYLAAVRGQMLDHLGEARLKGPLNSHANVFPNMGYLPGSGTLRVWHPIAHDEIEVWSWCVVDAAAPDEIKEASRTLTLRMFGPSGMLEQDDAENWAEAYQNSTSTIARRYPYNYQMGMGSEGTDPEYPGTTTFVYSEAAARAFYRRWLELMTDGDSGQ